MKEEYLLTGSLEPTNEPYAVAKITAIKLCQYYNEQYGTQFISAMPTNLYGPNDNFDLETSHVLPALIRKFAEAKHRGSAPVVLWGSGMPRREFLYVDDAADAFLFLMETDFKRYASLGVSHINVGSGRDLAINELARLVSDIVGYRGEIIYDASKPDGMPQKLLDVGRINRLGWCAKTSIEDGIRRTLEWYTAQTR